MSRKKKRFTVKLVDSKPRMMRHLAQSLGEMSLDRKRYLVLRENSPLSVVRQCEFLQIHRSGIYFKPKMEKQLNLRLMRLIDEKFMDCPFFGVPRITTWLRKDMGYMINEKRIARLYRLMEHIFTMFLMWFN